MTTNTPIYIQKALFKIYSREWKESAGVALTQTAGILHDMEDFQPIFSVLGGALAIGSIVLNNEHHLQDLRKEKEELDSAKTHFTGVVEKALTWRLEDIQDKLCDHDKEIVDNFDTIKKILQQEFQDISIHMTLLEKRMPKSCHIKDLYPEVFEGIRNADFKYVINATESAYKSFQNGAYNLPHYFSTKPYYMFYLQNMIEKELNPIRIQEHLDVVHNNYGDEECKQILAYIILLLSKNLQLITAFFLCQNDLKRVVFEFQRFNDFSEKFVIIYHDLTGDEFVTKKVLPPKSDKMSKQQSNNNSLPDVAKTGSIRYYANVNKITSNSSQDLRQKSIKAVIKALGNEDGSQTDIFFQSGGIKKESTKLFDDPQTPQTLNENNKEMKDVEVEDITLHNKGNVC